MKKTIITIMLTVSIMISLQGNMNSYIQAYAAEDTCDEILIIVDEEVIEDEPLTSIERNKEFKSKIVFYDKLKTSYKIKDFTPVLQLPELPTGCEVTALTQTLNYWGMDVSKTTMADKYLPKAKLGTTTFDKAFMENPYSTHSYGCFSPVIKKTAQNYFKNNKNDDFVVLNYTGKDIKTIYKIVNQGYPVIVWGTMDMKKPTSRYLWKTQDGTDVYWKSGEHCMTLIGFDFDKKTVTIADPLKGTVDYDMKTFETRYKDLGKQAIVIKPVE